MAILDTPIISDDNNLNKLFAQKLALLLILHDSDLDKPLLDSLQKEAKKQVGKLLVVRVNLRENPKAAAQYKGLDLPAVLLFADGKEMGKTEHIRPKDIRDASAHLLLGEALPEKPSVKLGKPILVTDASFREEVLKSKVPVLVDFWADWCGPCHSIAPYVEKLAEEFSGKLKVVKLDVDANRATTQRYGVNAFPTLLLFEAGQVADKTIGANPVGLRNMVQKAVNRQ